MKVRFPLTSLTKGLKQFTMITEASGKQCEPSKQKKGGIKKKKMKKKNPAVILNVGVEEKQV